MARRRRGRPVSGWLILDKPAGLGSTDAVSAARRLFDAQKAGHAGTLDPAATGLLAIALGEATKTVPYVADAQKAYRFAVRFGSATNTDDAEGAVIATAQGRPDAAALEAALIPLRGDIHQVPPQVSAVKVDGERAYARARAGEAMTLAPRPLHIARLEVVARPDPDTAILEMVCGKGGYVRAIARDLGASLGCLGHALWLRRLWSGPFALAAATTLEAVDAQPPGPARDALLAPVAAGLAGLAELPCTAEGAARLRHGNPGEVTRAPEDPARPAWASHRGQPVAVGRYRAGRLHPDRVFAPDPDS